MKDHNFQTLLMPVMQGIVDSCMSQHIFFMSERTHLEKHGDDRGISSDAGPNQGCFLCGVDRVDNKFIFDIVSPNFGIFSRFDSLKDIFTESVGFIAKQFLFEDIFYCDFIFL